MLVADGNFSYNHTHLYTSLQQDNTGTYFFLVHLGGKESEILELISKILL